MANDYHTLEPFPLFVDAQPPASHNYFSSNMSALQHALSSSKPPVSRKPQRSMLTRVSNYARLRYYQYEVTFSLYMMTPGEKVVLHTIVLSILLASLYALYIGLEPFVVRMICRIVYYLTGSFGGAEELCIQ